MKSVWLIVVLSITAFAFASEPATDALSKNELSQESVKAAAIVDGHLAAYNEHDLEGMLKYFHPDIEAYSFSGDLQLQGLASFREAFADTFSAKPKEVVVKRIIEGNHVIDQVDTTFHVNDRIVTERDTVIYTIEEGLIRKLTFL